MTINRTVPWAVVFAGLLVLSGCKFVKTDKANTEAAAAGEQGDDARNAKRLADTFESQFVPLLRQRAIDANQFKRDLTAGLDGVGQAHGVRAGGAGGAWNIAIQAKGLVVEEDRQSKAAVAGVDVDGDGKADVTLQLGPVVKGTALRDIAPAIYEFSKFRDQIEFAKLGRALNEKALANLSSVAKSPMKGKMVSVLGAAAVRSASDMPLIVPVTLEVVP